MAPALSLPQADTRLQEVIMYVVKLTTKSGYWYLRHTMSGKLVTFDTIGDAWAGSDRYPHGGANVSIEPYDSLPEDVKP